MPSPTDDDSLYHFLNHSSPVEVVVEWETNSGGPAKEKGFFDRKGQIISGDGQTIRFYPGNDTSRPIPIGVGSIQRITRTDHTEIWHRDTGS